MGGEDTERTEPCVLLLGPAGDASVATQGLSRFRQVCVARDIAEAEAALNTHRPSIIVMAEGCGDTCAAVADLVRREAPDTPVLMAPANSTEKSEAVLAALERLADALDTGSAHERPRKAPETSTKDASGSTSGQATGDPLDALGQTSTAIAHEINNPLAGIKNAMSLIRDAVDPTHPNAHFVDLVERELERIKNIVREMCQLHRTGPPEPSWFDMRETVEEVMKLVDMAMASKNVLFGFADTGKALGPVFLRRADVKQILWNLLVNAIEASPEGGRVEIAVRDKGAMFEIAVRDSGPGIRDEQQRQLFTPFYSTKSDGAHGGMGLGLPVSQRLAESMGGAIGVTSEPGRGAEFTVSLPRQLPGGISEPSTGGHDG